MIEQLSLRKPIYRQTTNYGHFGKPDSRGKPDRSALKQRGYDYGNAGG